MKYNIIAIEREYASGGLEIGMKLAEKLGIPCYGQEILEQAAARLQMTPERLMKAEENMTGSLLYGLSAFANISSGNGLDLLMLEQKLALAENEVIRDLGLNPCVLIGRGASAIFSERNDVLKVFIHADLKTRMERAVDLYGFEPKQAESILRRNDKRRANYFKATTQKEWKDADIYQMLLNSGKMGIEQTVDVLYAMTM